MVSTSIRSGCPCARCLCLALGLAQRSKGLLPSGTSLESVRIYFSLYSISLVWHHLIYLVPRRHMPQLRKPAAVAIIAQRQSTPRRLCSERWCIATRSTYPRRRRLILIRIMCILLYVASRPVAQYLVNIICHVTSRQASLRPRMRKPAAVAIIARFDSSRGRHSFC